MWTVAMNYDSGSQEKIDARKVSIRFASLFFDALGVVLTPFAATIAALHARGGAIRLPLSYKIWDWFGLQPVSHHYYQPIFNVHDLPSHTWTDLDPMVGVNFQVEQQIELLSHFAQYASELESFPISLDNASILSYCYENPNYSSGDAEIFYSMLRHTKPRRIIEIGSGFSTRIAKAALEKNKQDGFTAKHICVEPYEMRWLEDLGVDEIIRSKVENVDLSIFDQLEENDILFIDSSHVIRTGGDVVVEYLKILPQLKKGVIVHIHDIFMPYDYPQNWIQEHRRFWDEQYLLQAFLAFNSAYEVTLASHYLSRKYTENFDNACPVYARKYRKLPVSSFWIKRVN
jgi:predicted O-methyltransferase YrrM